MEEVLAALRRSGGGTIALTEDEAVDCLKAGATDYVLKQRLQRLAPAASRAPKANSSTNSTSSSTPATTSTGVCCSTP